VSSQNHWEYLVTMGIMPDNPKTLTVIYASHEVSAVQKHM